MSDSDKSSKAVNVPTRANRADSVTDGTRAPKNTPRSESFFDDDSLSRPAFYSASAYGDGQSRPKQQSGNNGGQNAVTREMLFRVAQSPGTYGAPAGEAYSAYPNYPGYHAYQGYQQRTPGDTSLVRPVTMNDYIQAVGPSTASDPFMSQYAQFSTMYGTQQQGRPEPVPYSVYPYDPSAAVQRPTAQEDPGAAPLRVGKRKGRGNMAAATGANVKMNPEWEIDDELKAQWRAHLEREKEKNRKESE